MIKKAQLKLLKHLFNFTIGYPIHGSLLFKKREGKALECPAYRIVKLKSKYYTILHLNLRWKQCTKIKEF